MNDSPASLATFAQYVNAPYVGFLKRIGLELKIVRAQGACLFDGDGRQFIDCLAGYGNLNVGHNHPKIVAAVVAEMSSPRTFNWPFPSDAHAALVERLAGLVPGDLECSHIVNSGSEAVDSALKLVRLATGKPHIVCARGAWHGFTLGAMSISEPAMARDFAPLLPDVSHVDYGDAAAVERAIGDRTGAVIVEPIQAESGAVVPPAGYLNELKTICQRKGVVLIFDEIKTGIAKTGRMFACNHDDVAPDIILLGKSLGGGLMPVGVMTARRELWGKFGFSFAMSSSSGGGNAPACAAGLATLDVVESEDLCQRAAGQGEKLRQALLGLVRDFPGVCKNVSGRGLLLALHAHTAKQALAIVTHCIGQRVIMLTAFLDRTRILVEPPLCITDLQLEQVIDALQSEVRRVDLPSGS